ncbi:GNAT family N-acetyltransferase [Actinopolymorpha singaporensis]|uniref:Acetyltransferase (GNAT) domain-containing protein n=1 Tax=Actinopolymorpha singaporensis TaxID=117157 RepID=A0A1H1RRC9_9ACTN|nr:GNAT family N-acetyltransferase [Actinopolymorpha singaporensis]SDS38301.1 Acetyltransferase (GNAT) domain-containing protein [Actinopolymorpha singaporensis]
MNASPQEPRFVEFADDALPAELRWQVLSFLRIVWPEGFTGDLRYRDWITRAEYQPYHLLYVADSLVVSHLEIVDHEVGCDGVTYQAQALTSVLTFPPFRREGWASRLVATACRRIEAGDGDLGLICCSPEKVGFYAAPPAGRRFRVSR